MKREWDFCWKLRSSVSIEFSCATPVFYPHSYYDYEFLAPLSPPQFLFHVRSPYDWVPTLFGFSPRPAPLKINRFLRCQIPLENRTVFFPRTVTCLRFRKKWRHYFFKHLSTRKQCNLDNILSQTFSRSPRDASKHAASGIRGVGIVKGTRGWGFNSSFAEAISCEGTTNIRWYRICTRTYTTPRTMRKCLGYVCSHVGHLVTIFRDKMRYFSLKIGTMLGK